MAKVFLDTNFYIDVVYRKPEVLKTLESSIIYFSPLSTHILFYALKIKTPSKIISKITDPFQAVDLTKDILDKALSGPTSDLEDNIQLHCAAQIPCDFFLTNDEKLLNMKFFGKTRITENILGVTGVRSTGG